jgi:very-short-patch-repair endonuclease
VHQARAVEVVRRHGIAVTTAARTLLDVAPQLDRRELARAVEEAQVQALATRTQLEALVARSGGHRGVGALAAAVAACDEPRFTRSRAERRLLELVRRARLPEPAANARVGRLEVDALWPAQRLVVEVDGWRFHSSRAAFERDRERDAELQAAGFRVARVTWRQLVSEPEAVVARLAAALAFGTPS